jgi:hypothetical protein
LFAAGAVWHLADMSGRACDVCCWGRNRHHDAEL